MKMPSFYLLTVCLYHEVFKWKVSLGKYLWKYFVNGLKGWKDTLNILWGWKQLTYDKRKEHLNFYNSSHITEWKNKEFSVYTFS